ncbi:MAG: glycosyltransferase family 39 protein [Phycisphaerae bacterium]|nr:glycosyltransferase family 39 protein [Phycisphaerae bacterium]
MDGQPPTTPTETGPPRVWWLFALVFVTCLYGVFPNARPDLTPFNCDDSEAYIGLANSIATGRGYTRCLNPDQHLPHKTWPPGLPLLLAPAICLFGLNLAAIKFVMIGVGIVGLVFFYLLVRDLTDVRLAAWTATATACCAHYFWFSHQVMSEVPLFTASVVVLWLLNRAAREPLHWRWWVPAGIVLGYGAIIKGLALLIVPAALVVVWRASGSQRRAVATRYVVFVLIALMPMIAWSVRNSRVEAQSLDGINQFRMLLQETPNDPNSPLITPRSLVKQIYANVIWGIIYRAPDQVLPLARWADLRHRSGGPVIALVLTGLVVVALLVSAWRRVRPIHVYALCVLGVLSLFSTGGTARYFVPLAPLFIFFIADAVRGSRWWSRLGPLATVVAAVWLAAAVVDLCSAIHRQETRPYADRQWGQFVDIARASAEFVPAEATVFVHNGNAFTLVSRRRTWISQPGVPFDLEGALQSGRITHLVVSLHGRPRDAGRRVWVRDHRSWLRSIGANEGYEVLVPSGPASHAAAAGGP